MRITASAPAKIILFGEHFVVYGEPAIVLAIDKRAYATIEKREDKRIFISSPTLKLAGCYGQEGFTMEQGDAKEGRIKFEPVKLAVDRILEKYGTAVGLSIEINSTVPVGAGLGSSAAVVAATAAATCDLLKIPMSKESIFRITMDAEKIVHGTPSGIDPAIATFGGIMHFQMDTGFKPLELDVDIPLIVGDTGVVRSTRLQVEKVKSMMDKYPRVIETMMKTAREIVISAMDALREKDFETLGVLMNINHALLYGLGVSAESLESLAIAARKAGALGAKLTGAGGGGCMIALSTDDRLTDVSEAIQRAGGRPFTARKTDEGVRIEQK